VLAAGALFFAGCSPGGVPEEVSTPILFPEVVETTTTPPTTVPDSPIPSTTTIPLPPTTTTTPQVVEDSPAPVGHALTFTPEEDFFSFENFGGGEAPADLTVNMARRLYGDDQVCSEVTDNRCTPYPVILQLISQANRSMRGGLCEGLAVLSLRLAGDLKTLASFQGTDTVAQLIKADPALLSEIAYWYVTQFAIEVQQEASSYLEMSPKQLAEVLLYDFAESEAGNKYTGFTMGIYSEHGGHAVTPYKVVQVPTGYRIYVYDSNWPSSERWIDVDEDGWVYALASTNPTEQSEAWSGGTGTMELTPMSVRSGPFTCGFCPQEGTTKSGTLLTVAASGSKQMSLKIVTESGQRLGYYDEGFVNEIPGATYRYLISGPSTSDPVLVFLPPDVESFTADVEEIDVPAPEAVADATILGEIPSPVPDGNGMEPPEQEQEDSNTQRFSLLVLNEEKSVQIEATVDEVAVEEEETQSLLSFSEASVEVAEIEEATVAIAIDALSVEVELDEGQQIELVFAEESDTDEPEILDLSIQDAQGEVLAEVVVDVSAYRVETTTPSRDEPDSPIPEPVIQPVRLEITYDEVLAEVVQEEEEIEEWVASDAEYFQAVAEGRLEEVLGETWVEEIEEIGDWEPLETDSDFDLVEVILSVDEEYWEDEQWEAEDFDDEYFEEQEEEFLEFFNEEIELEEVLEFVEELEVDEYWEAEIELEEPEPEPEPEVVPDPEPEEEDEWIESDESTEGELEDESTEGELEDESIEPEPEPEVEEEPELDEEEPEVEEQPEEEPEVPAETEEDPAPEPEEEEPEPEVVPEPEDSDPEEGSDPDPDPEEDNDPEPEPPEEQDYEDSAPEEDDHVEVEEDPEGSEEPEQPEEPEEEILPEVEEEPTPDPDPEVVPEPTPDPEPEVAPEPEPVDPYEGWGDLPPGYATWGDFEQEVAAGIVAPAFAAIFLPEDVAAEIIPVAVYVVTGPIYVPTATYEYTDTPISEILSTEVSTAQTGTTTTTEVTGTEVTGTEVTGTEVTGTNVTGTEVTATNVTGTVVTADTTSILSRDANDGHWHTWETTETSTATTTATTTETTTAVTTATTTDITTATTTATTVTDTLVDTTTVVARTGSDMETCTFYDGVAAGCATVRGWNPETTTANTGDAYTEASTTSATADVVTSATTSATADVVTSATADVVTTATTTASEQVEQGCSEGGWTGMGDWCIVSSGGRNDHDMIQFTLDETTNVDINAESNLTYQQFVAGNHEYGDPYIYLNEDNNSDEGDHTGDESAITVGSLIESDDDGGRDCPTSGSGGTCQVPNSSWTDPDETPTVRACVSTGTDCTGLVVGDLTTGVAVIDNPSDTWDSRIERLDLPAGDYVVRGSVYSTGHDGWYRLTISEAE